MDDALRSAGWIVIVAIAGAYGTFLASSAIFKSPTATSTPVVVRDVLQKGEHHLFGKIVVASSCDEVSVKVLNTSSDSYELAFTTWTEPEGICIRGPTERTFDTIIFAPSIGVQFSASLDKNPVPIAVYPVITN